MRILDVSFGWSNRHTSSRLRKGDPIRSIPMRGWLLILMCAALVMGDEHNHIVNQCICWLVSSMTTMKKSLFGRIPSVLMSIARKPMNSTSFHSAVDLSSNTIITMKRWVKLYRACRWKTLASKSTSKVFTFYLSMANDAVYDCCSQLILTSRCTFLLILLWVGADQVVNVSICKDYRLNTKQINLFKFAISNLYSYSMFLDDLPIGGGWSDGRQLLMAVCSWS